MVGASLPMQEHDPWSSPVIRPIPQARSVTVRILLCLLVISGSAFVFATSSTAGGTTPILGLLGASDSKYTQDALNGVQAVTIQVGWDFAEPTSTGFSSTYMIGNPTYPGPLTKVNEALAAGLQVIIDPGLQYPPTWVVSLPDSQFKNQYGTPFSGPAPSGNNVVNAVTNMTIQGIEGTYLSWLGQQFAPGSITAVREGGGPLGELRYPLPEDALGNYNDSYWAYDADTQAALPASVRGWVPGTGTPLQAQVFLEAYNRNLNSYGEWLNGQLEQDFNTKVILLLPGWGDRPGVAQNLENTLLQPSQAPYYVEFNEGLDWADLLANLPYPADSVAYTTYLDATANPGGPAPADYLNSLVAGTSIRLGGENTGNGTVSILNYCAGRAQALNFYLFEWMGESQLGASAGGPNDPPSLAQLGAAFAAATPPTTTTTTTTPPATGGGGAAPVSVATSSLPVATQHQSYSTSLAANSSAPVTSWSLASGSLPSGLSLNGSTGVISGVPSATGVSAFTVRVGNSAGGSALAGLAISVAVGTAPQHLSGSVVGIAATPGGGGYWIAASNGGVAPFGNAAFYGSMAGRPLNSPINHIVATPDGQGYWLVAADGGTFTFGDARFYGSMGGRYLNAPVVDLAPTPDGRGYWLVASDGGIFAFGDARFHGSMGGSHLNRPVVGITADAATGGYWLVASDGGIFAFGAPFFGSTGAIRLNLPINGMTSTADGRGYWFVASDGGIFSFGDARFHGSAGAVHLTGPIVGMAADVASGGYWLVGSGGAIFSFAAPFYGAA
jgi:Putative Ig domain